jgi:ABC-type transport system involved in cytochrome c biogenesis ATPase subunit
MKLSHIKIEGLFGQFDYDIKLNQEEGITILTGPNGYGKTTILNIIWGLFHQDFNSLQKAKSVSLLFNKGMSLVFTIKKEQGQDPWVYPIITVLQVEAFSNDEKIGFEKHIYDGTGNTDKFTEEKITELIQSQTVYFIRDQRLTCSAAATRDGTFKRDGTMKRDGAAVLNRIDMFSQDLANRIAHIKSKEDKLAVSLADSFPDRLLKYGQALPHDVFEKRFETLSQKQQRLHTYGITPGVFTRSEYEGENRRVLSVYLEDYERKTALYDELLTKLDLFFSILNEKGLVNKTIAVKAKGGFSFVTSKGGKLPLAALSSGEQNEIILLYELLFNASSHSLVLIDEPETSMHIAWQIEFLQDMENIAKLSGLSFIIATHSPDLINDKMDLCVDLFENTRRNGHDGK